MQRKRIDEFMNEDKREKRESVAKFILRATKNAFGMHRNACGIVVGRKTPLYF